MKRLFYILSCLILIGCGQFNLKQNTLSVSDTISTDNKVSLKPTREKQNEKKHQNQTLSGFETVTLYKLTDTITADFNGDGILDKAIYNKNKETSGIIIVHGKTNEKIKIGFGKQFAHMTEFNWVDYWGLVEDKTTTETTFTNDGDILDNKTVKLQNPSIVLGNNEMGGGLITYRNGKYEWIHQTC